MSLALAFLNLALVYWEPPTTYTDGTPFLPSDRAGVQIELRARLQDINGVWSEWTDGQGKLYCEEPFIPEYQPVMTCRAQGSCHVEPPVP